MPNKVYTLHNVNIIGGEFYNNRSFLTVNAESVSDGHHTMEELYKHRHALFTALLNNLYGSNLKRWKSKLHDDGTMYDGWFIAGVTKYFANHDPIDIAYHMPMEWWDRIEIPEVKNAPKYTGYTSDDVIERLINL